ESCFKWANTFEIFSSYKYYSWQLTQEDSFEIQQCFELGIVEYDFNPSTQEAETGGSMSMMLVLFTLLPSLVYKTPSGKDLQQNGPGFLLQLTLFSNQGIYLKVSSREGPGPGRSVTLLRTLAGPGRHPHPHSAVLVRVLGGIRTARAGTDRRRQRKKPAKMSLYPSLEDLKVDKVIQAQAAFSASPATQAVLVDVSAAYPPDGNLYPKLYPELSEYMGLTLNEEEICTNMPMVSGAPTQGLVARPSSVNYMVAPVTGNDAGIRRAEIKQGIREVILCKDQDGKIGLRLKSIDNGVFVQLVQANSPASLVGLRFGDQVLQINGDNCAGWSSDKAHKVLKQAFGERITMTIRDRPFERTITMHKDSSGHVGFIFKSGKITSIVKDSSAARNGLLTDHHICEINGQNVIGLKDGPKHYEKPDGSHHS
ncbi:hypothetical protein STEG23_036252, partial [Scotinomys teguina]